MDQLHHLNVVQDMPPRSRQQNSASQPDLFAKEGVISASAGVVFMSGSGTHDLAAHESVERTYSTDARASSARSVRGHVRGIQRRSVGGPHQCSVRVLTVQDMPTYPPDLIAAAKRSIKDVSSPRVFLTYKEIDGYFGISRATVARRLKDGLVPGIRILHGRVLEDGPVRRLDREQLLYLLLAVRANRSN